MLILLNHAQWAPHLSAPALPHLSALCGACWAQATEVQRPGATFTPLEAWQAKAAGLQINMAGLPWADWLAQHQGLNDPRPAALITPCHWDINMTGVRMDDPDQLQLSDADSQALMNALAPLAEEDGITLRWINAQHWLAHGEVFADLRSPSAAALVGEDLDAHLPQVPQTPAATRLLRRLQNEAQMLFYSHPVHDSRHAQRLPAVNSIWYHGTGRAQRADNARPSTALSVLDALREHPELAAAWTHIDEQVGAIVQAHPQAELVVANPRGARHWQRTPPPWWQRWRTQRLSNLLEHLP